MTHSDWVLVVVAFIGAILFGVLCAVPPFDDPQWKVWIGSAKKKLLRRR